MLTRRQSLACDKGRIDDARVGAVAVVTGHEREDEADILLIEGHFYRHALGWLAAPDAVLWLVVLGQQIKTTAIELCQKLTKVPNTYAETITISCIPIFPRNRVVGLRCNLGTAVPSIRTQWHELGSLRQALPCPRDLAVTRPLLGIPPPSPKVQRGGTLNLPPRCTAVCREKPVNACGEIPYKATSQ